MAKDFATASEQWERYVYARDTGHLDFVRKARICDDFFAGYPNRQWDSDSLRTLREQRRPSLTINKILSTLSSIMGEQIDLRTETAYKARFGASSENADVLTKLFKYVSDRNQLQWVRSEMFANGSITSRGYVDIRMNFDKSVTGDIHIRSINPRNVMPDPDAASYDPEEWSDVMESRWHSVDEISLMYSPEAAKELGERSSSVYPEGGYDSLDMLKDRFGGSSTLTTVLDGDKHITKMIRVIERQHKKLSKVKFIINLRTGDRKRIPDSYKPEEINELLARSNANGGSFVIDEVVAPRIRWTVTAEDYVLHDDWSPYRHFTIVPYFPYFRNGTTIGLVENLIDPQELLNKTTSQELHVINTTANSGWMIRRNSLKNMTMDELEQNGARTGLVLEVENIGDAEKIQPNQIPAGLDRLSSKAEGYIKSVSARGDAQMGMTRADVSADQIEANNAFGDVGLRVPMDNLARTDHLIARVVLDLIQEYMTDSRAMMITANAITGEQSEIKINWPDPESGEIINDVTMGEYDVVVISQPARQTLEEGQFQQLVMLRDKLGIQIPEEFLIESSQVLNKTGIISALKAQAESPEAQAQAQLQKVAAQLEVANLKEEAARLEADALLKRAKAAHTTAQALKEAGEDPTQDAEMQRDAAKAQQDMTLQREKHQQDMQIQREKAALDADLARQKAKDDAILKRAQAVMAMRQQAKAGAEQAPEKQAA